MKQLIVITLLTFLSMACLGQSMFFNNLEGSIWTSDSNVVDSTVSNISGFGLERLTAHKDSIKTDRTIWLFKEVLTITHYDATTKNETIIGSYDYHIEERLLLINFDKKHSLRYSVGIVSSGSFVFLTKKKISQQGRP
jgi:hypothetical protein